MTKFLSILLHCSYQSIMHPRTTVTQVANPIPIHTSPIPWWGSIAILMIGIAAWVGGDVLEVPGLCEAARAMVYIPLGSMFGMTFQISQKVK